MFLPAITTALGAATLTAAWKCYQICFHSPVRGRPDPYAPLVGAQYETIQDTLFRIIGIMERYPYEDVSTDSHDGLLLRGRYYHFRDGAPVMILFHGYRSNALRDCCGGHALAQKLGFNALVIHQRAHGESQGKTISFGIRERRDVHSWIHWARHRLGEDVPIILSGLSMGAATVLMGCGLGYPKNVACVIADSPYSAPADIIRKVCRDSHYPDAMYPLIRLGARIYGGFRLDECTAAEAVRHASSPILLIHGEDDRLVPCDMSRTIAENNPQQCRICTVPKAAHGLAYMTDPEGYEEAVMDFLGSIPALSPFLPTDGKNSEK